MSDQPNISDFSYVGGLNIGKNDNSQVDLYGLPDFWKYVFQDTELNNIFLEAVGVLGSDIYNTFTQMCSGLAIPNISNSASNQIRLEVVSNTPSLPTDVPISSGSWTAGFTTIVVVDSSVFSVGDVISVSGVADRTVYDVGDGINFNPINAGGVTQVVGAQAWNGVFTIVSVNANGAITYYQPENPGVYTNSGTVTTLNIGINTYILPEPIISTRYIANSPYKPTIVLESDIDFSLGPDPYRISFAQDPGSYGFPASILPNGSVQYALWFVDVRYELDVIYSQYPILLGQKKPALYSVDYRNYLLGLYYIYTSGPSLTTLEKGINMALGIPLALDNETVLDIRTYLNTGQYIVLTDLNSYIIPYGLSPIVSIGSPISIGDELAKWVEIQDYISNGAWWRTYNITIPAEIMEIPPVGYDRLVVGGGDYGDWLMTTFFKNNTFLIKVNITGATFNSIQKFGSIFDLVTNLKPKHTFPIYHYAGSYTVDLTPASSTTSLGTIVGTKVLPIYSPAFPNVVPGIQSPIIGVGTPIQ